MAQSALTVTPPSPTPPTNFSSVGATPPQPPNFTKNTYNDPKNWSYVNPKDYPPPYFDDGAAGALHLFAANTAALASGSAATAGGTEGTYPGAASGAVPVSTSVAAEGAGTETSVLAPGNIVHTYVGAVTMNTSQSVSAGPVATAATREAGPNATHASSLSPTTNPAFTGLLVATATAAASGTQLFTCQGTNFTPGCRIWIDNIERSTTFGSASSLTATVNKKATAGVWLVDVKLGGVAVPSQRTFTWT